MIEKYNSKIINSVNTLVVCMYSCLHSVYTVRGYQFAMIVLFLLMGINGYPQEQANVKLKKFNDLKNEINTDLSAERWSEGIVKIEALLSELKLASQWDSVYHYNGVLSEAGRLAGDLNTEIKGYLDRMSQSRMMKNYDKDEYMANGAFIAANIDPDRLNIKMLNQAYLTYSKFLWDQSYIDSTIVTLEKALSAADLSEDVVAQILTRLEFGVKLQYLKKYERKLNLLLEAEKIAQNAKPEPVFQFRIYNEIGRLLYKINDLDKAESYATKAVKVASDAGLNLFMADAEAILGQLNHKRGKYDDALTYFNIAIKKYKDVGYRSKQSYTYLNRAKAELDMNKLQDARLSIDSSIIVGGNKSITYKVIDANINILTGNLREVNSFLLESGDDDNFWQEYRDIFYKLSYQYHKKVGNNSEALSNYEYYIKTRDSIASNFRELKIQRIESEFNREKQDAKITNLNQLTAAQDKAIAVRNTAIWLGGIMMLVLAGLLYGLYKLYAKDQKNQEDLAAQNVQITKALGENQILIKEIHHRVKNNLQVVSSLLSMQARKMDDGETKDALNSSKTRVQSMSILHQNLYQENDVTRVNVEDYLGKLIDNIIDTYSIDDSVEVTTDIDHIMLDVDILVPLGLIANELICNAFKYAYQGRSDGKLIVSFKSENDILSLRVADDGVGLDGNELPIKKGSLGARLIKSFTDRLEGEIRISDSEGTDISIVFEKSKLGLDD